jgi:hypothetical protein
MGSFLDDTRVMKDNEAGSAETARVAGVAREFYERHPYPPLSTCWDSPSRSVSTAMRGSNACRAVCRILFVSKERLPPGAAAALINRTHTYTDLYLSVDATVRNLFVAIDGERTIGEIACEQVISETARAPLRSYMVVRSGYIRRIV